MVTYPEIKNMYVLAIICTGTTTCNEVHLYVCGKVRESNFDGGEIFLTLPDQLWDL